jgi:hypothetical protein
LFLKSKTGLKGLHSETVCDIQGELQVVLNNIMENYLHTA